MHVCEMRRGCIFHDTVEFMHGPNVSSFRYYVHIVIWRGHGLGMGRRGENTMLLTVQCGNVVEDGIA